jgi:hypothetical protein
MAKAKTQETGAPVRSLPPARVLASPREQDELDS